MENFPNNLLFPEIFITGELPNNWCKESLVADGLVGWANCSLGAIPPKNFGKGMVLINQKVGVATPKELSQLADKILSQK